MKEGERTNWSWNEIFAESFIHWTSFGIKQTENWSNLTFGLGFTFRFHSFFQKSKEGKPFRCFRNNVSWWFPTCFFFFRRRCQFPVEKGNCSLTSQRPRRTQTSTVQKNGTMVQKGTFQFGTAPVPLRVGSRLWTAPLPPVLLLLFLAPVFLVLLVFLWGGTLLLWGQGGPVGLGPFAVAPVALFCTAAGHRKGEPQMNRMKRRASSKGMELLQHPISRSNQCSWLHLYRNKG